MLAAVLAQWVLIRWLGDVWWLGTVVMFAPRWTLLVPLVPLATACANWRRRLLWLNFATLLLVLGPVMGFSFALPSSAGVGNQPRLRLVSFNAGNGSKIERIRAELAALQPDVVAIQETPSRQPQFLFDSTWHIVRARGLTIASRHPILQHEVFGGSPAVRWIDLGLRALLDTPAGEVWVICLYMESPRDGFESLMLTRRGLHGTDEVRQSNQRRNLQSQLLRDWVAEVEGPLLVAGDFNQPPESYFFRRDWSAFQDAFAQAGNGYGYNWHSSWHGLRIDHILANNHWQFIGCQIGADFGGDHRPVIAELMFRE